MSSASSEEETWTLDMVDSSLPQNSLTPKDLHIGSCGHGLKRVTGHEPQAVGLLEARMQSEVILG